MPFDLLGLAPQKTAEGQIADKAADYIEDHGWTKCVFSNGSGEVCVLGALAHLQGAPVGKAYESFEYWREKGEVLTRALGFTFMVEIISWNDHSTKEAVLSRLRATR